MANPLQAFEIAASTRVGVSGRNWPSCQLICCINSDAYNTTFCNACVVLYDSLRTGSQACPVMTAKQRHDTWRLNTLRASGSSLRADTVSTGAFNADIPACRHLDESDRIASQCKQVSIKTIKLGVSYCCYLPAGELQALTEG